MEIPSKQDFERLERKIDQLLSSGGTKDSEVLILDSAAVKKATGYSETMIQKLIISGRLNPWKDDDAKNSKLRFYKREVDKLVPSDLIEKYG